MTLISGEWNVLARFNVRCKLHLKWNTQIDTQITD